MMREGSLLCLLLLMFSMSAYSCDEKSFKYSGDIEDVFSDEKVEDIIGFELKIIGNNCDIYNFALDNIDQNIYIAGAIFCNLAWKGVLDGAYNCGIFLIKKIDVTKGSQIINELNRHGYKKAGFYLLKKSIERDGYSSSTLIELEKYKDEMHQAKFIYDYIKCKLNGSMELHECME